MAPAMTMMTNGLTIRIMIAAMTTMTEQRTRPLRIVGALRRSLTLSVACLAGTASGSSEAPALPAWVAAMGSDCVGVSMP